MVTVRGGPVVRVAYRHLHLCRQGPNLLYVIGWEPELLLPLAVPLPPVRVVIT